MINVEEYEALKYLISILDSDDGYLYSYPLKKVKSKINCAPQEVKRFLKEYCPTVEHLKEYLSRYKDLFLIENGRVALFQKPIQDGSDKAVPYFEDILDTYETLPSYKNFYGHIGQADQDIKAFLLFFYGRNFKQFLLNHPDVFVLFNDDTVSLIENEAVKYFQQRLKEGREGWYYMNLRGCIGQAPEHVIEFINNYYPEEDFWKFLVGNSYAFETDEEGCVYLN